MSKFIVGGAVAVAAIALLAASGSKDEKKGDGAEYRPMGPSRSGFFAGDRKFMSKGVYVGEAAERDVPRFDEVMAAFDGCVEGGLDLGHFPSQDQAEIACVDPAVYAIVRRIVALPDDAIQQWFTDIRGRLQTTQVYPPNAYDRYMSALADSIQQMVDARNAGIWPLAELD